jgi:hypothetical protein
MSNVEVAAIAAKPTEPPPLPRRWGFNLPAHPEIRAVLDAHRDIFKTTLHEIYRHRDFFHSIGLSQDPSDPYSPLWNNWYFTSLDAAALTGLMLSRRPSLLIEIGSGNSTRFARRAIKYGGLPTKLISIDPEPRYEIDAICDRAIRTELQKCNLSIFYDLQPGDMLFLDGSHFLQPDTDVTIFFLDIIPRLKPGVLVQIHDVFWPYDYSRRWNLPMSEQYILGLMLIAKPLPFKIVLANYYASLDPGLSEIMRYMFAGRDGTSNLPVHYPDAPDFLSRSFWFETISRS